MKNFIIYDSKGNKGNITLGGVKQDGPCTRVEVVELKIGNKILFEDEIASFGIHAKTNTLLLTFENRTSLKITNQDLIEYVNKLNNNNKRSTVYSFTREYEANYLD